MDDLISKLQEKAGLTADQAKQAIATLVDHVKSKVPESLHGSIDSIFSGAMDKASGLADEAKQKAGELGDKAEDFVKGFGDKLSGFFGGKSE